MQAFLMNFGDNSRVVNDAANAAVMIGIGKIVECDIHEVHFQMIRRAVGTETLMAVPRETRITPRLRTIMDILIGIDTQPYDELLQAFFKALPPPGIEEGQYRPTRDMIRVALREAARKEVGAALQLQSKVNIREQGDAITRQVPMPGPAINVPVGPETIKAPAIDKKPVVKSSSKKRPKPAKPVVKSGPKRERL